MISLKASETEFQSFSIAIARGMSVRYVSNPKNYTVFVSIYLQLYEQAIAYNVIVEDNIMSSL